MPRRNGEGIALLADPTRLRIIALIAIRPRRPSTIARELGLGRAGITRHLNLMRDAGLVVAHRSVLDGRWLQYGITPHKEGAIIAWLAGTGVTTPDERADRSP